MNASLSSLPARAFWAGSEAENSKGCKKEIKFCKQEKVHADLQSLGK
jgi:hypothetical protein